MPSVSRQTAGESMGVLVANIQRGRRPVIVTEGDQ